jgi:hypothetical protein
MTAIARWSPAMTEQEIVELIAHDSWMMDVLGIAATLALPHWLIGAGFLRNKVWDHLHGHSNRTMSGDIDLVYFDPSARHDDRSLQAHLARLRPALTWPTLTWPTLTWDVTNQATAHLWNGEAPCGSVREALSRWPETATAVGVTLQDGIPAVIAPLGIADLTNLIVRPTPAFMASDAAREKVRTRCRDKRWQTIWPRLTLVL